MSLVVGIIGLIFFFWVHQKINHLNKRIEELEIKTASSASLTQQPTSPQQQSAPAAGTHTATNAAQPNTFQPHSISQIPRNDTSQSPISALFAWLSEDIFLKLGALLLLMGFGWFVSYAFINDWIGPVGRISLGLLAGLAFMGVGTWRVKDYRQQGFVFLVLGSGTVLLTIYAARALYEFLTPGTSLLVMFLSVAYVGFVSVLYQSDKLALAGLVMAAIAPLLTNTPEPSVVGLFSYLLVVIVGTIWIVRQTGSHVLTLAALVVAFLYSLPFIDAADFTSTDQTAALLFAFVFAALFFGTNTISILKQNSSAARKGQIVTALFTGLYLVFWIELVVASDIRGLLYVLWMLIFSAGSFVVYTKTVDRTPFFMYSAVTIGLLFAATATELSGPVLTLAYTAEVTALLLLARQYIAKSISEKLVWLFVLPVFLSLESLNASSWNSGFLHWDLVTLLVTAAGLGVVGWVYLQTRVAGEEKNHFAEVLLGVSAFYLLSLVWLISHSVLAYDVATTVSLIIYTVLGLALLLIGRTQDNKLWQLCGGVLLGLVVARLLLIDVWQMDLVGRIVTFFVVGGLLISTAFIGKNKSTTSSPTHLDNN